MVGNSEPVAIRGPRRPFALDTSWIGRALLAAAVSAAAVALSLSVGYGVASGNALVWLGVLGLGLCAVVAAYAKLRPETLLLGWLFLAPLLGDSARQTNIGFALYGVAYVLPLGLFVVHLLRSHPLSRPIRWYDWLPLSYVALIVVSQAVVDLPTAMEPGFYTNLVHSGVLIGVIAYYFCAFGPIGRLSSSRLAAVLLGSSALVALMGIIEHYTFWNLWSQEQIDDPPRIVGTLSSPGMVGAFLGTGIVLATAILVWDGPRHLRRPAIATLVLAIPALLFTYTRGAILPAVVVAVLLVAAKPRARLVGAGAAVVLGVFLAANWSSLTGAETYQERDPTDAYNVSTRLLIATASVELAKERPVLGTGYGTFDEAKEGLTYSTGALPSSALYGYTSHNTYLTILVELGAVGLALYVLPWLIVAVGTLRRIRRDRRASWMMLAALGSVAVIALTALSTDLRFFSFVPALVWIYVGLLRRAQWDPAFLA